jgi:hypothetical protein
MVHRFGIIVLAAVAMGGPFVGAGRPAQAMELGTNFWNPSWHRPDDCFQNIHDVDPASHNPWNPQFLREISLFKSFRFMDWDHTNGSGRRSWSQRPPRSARRQSPVAYEWMIDLCNRSRADLWVTVPHLTIDRTHDQRPSDYALRLCLLVKTGVDMREVDLTPLLDKLQMLSAADLVAAGGVKTCEPLHADLKLYVEYSNETWNGAFKQSHYCCDEGLALGLDNDRWTAGFRFHAWAAIRMFRAADLVFGSDNPRVVKVLATQAANSWIAGQHLHVLGDKRLNPWGTKADAIAIAPYFGHGVDGAADDVVPLLHAAIDKSVQHAARHRQLADDADLRLIAYEGGQHVTKNAKAVNSSPLMYDLYQRYLKALSAHVDHLSHYCHVGRAGDGGCWGAIEYTGQPREHAHKYRALVDFARQQAEK